MYEELFIGIESLETAHPRIRMANEPFLRLNKLQRHLDELAAAIAEGRVVSVRRKLEELLEPELVTVQSSDSVVTPFPRHSTAT